VEGSLAAIQATNLREYVFRQGVQDAEAMIYLAESLGEHAEQLGPDLAARCEQILADRIRFCLRTCPETYGRVGFRTYHHSWQDRIAELYATAAEAQSRRSP